MAAKVCPRCGAMYTTLKSSTCPQCFALLVEVDDATADELEAARRSVEQTPEFQEARAQDDEKFREQSFGACLGVILITVATLIFCIGLLFFAAHKQKQARGPGLARTQSLADPLPALVGGYRRVEADHAATVPGTPVKIRHAVYQSGTDELVAYATPADLPADRQSAFEQAATLGAQMGGKPGMPLFFTQGRWHYAIVAPGSAAEAFRRELP